MFLIEIDGEYYHSKYQFAPLFQTKDGRWAGPYDRYSYEHEFNEDTTIKPERIDFPVEATVTVSEVELQNSDPDFYGPYYKLEGNRLIPLFGNYVDELFELRKNGVLRARGQFK